MKQTSIEWLESELKKLPMVDVTQVFQQAKAMEKKQISDAFRVGCQVESTRLIGYHEMAEQYYNEQYGK